MRVANAGGAETRREPACPLPLQAQSGTEAHLQHVKELRLLRIRVHFPPAPERVAPELRELLRVQRAAGSLVLAADALEEHAAKDSLAREERLRPALQHACLLAREPGEGRDEHCQAGAM